MYVNYKTWSGNAISSNLWKSAWATSVVQFCKTDCSVEAAGVSVLDAHHLLHPLLKGSS